MDLFLTILSVLAALQLGHAATLLPDRLNDKLCAAIDCSSGPPKQLVLGNVKFCEHNLYCECDDQGVAHLRECSNLLLLLPMKFNPDAQKCQLFFSCKKWAKKNPVKTTTTAPTTRKPTTPRPRPTRRSTTRKPTTTPAPTPNPNMCHMIECGGTRPRLQLIPQDVDTCAAGVYCQCESDGIAYRQKCPVIWFVKRYLNPESQECEVTFDCAKWFRNHPPEPSEDTTSPGPTNMPATLVPPTSNPNMCHMIKCQNMPRLQLIPNDVDTCASGVYCQCESDGIAYRQKCPVIWFVKRYLNPESQECEVTFDCAKWFRNHPPQPSEDTTSPGPTTTPIPTFTPQLTNTPDPGATPELTIKPEPTTTEERYTPPPEATPTKEPPTNMSEATTTQKPTTTPDPTTNEEPTTTPAPTEPSTPNPNMCHMIKCQNMPRLQLIPNDVDTCASGVYCQCESDGIAYRQKCPVIWFVKRYLNPESQECEVTFDCAKWFRNHPPEPSEDTTPPMPTTTPEPASTTQMTTALDSTVTAEPTIKPDPTATEEPTTTREPTTLPAPTEPPTPNPNMCHMIKCQNMPRLQLIPNDVDTCASGVYCQCESDGIAYRQKCPVIWFVKRYLNPDSQECEVTFDCAKWFKNHQQEPCDNCPPAH